MRRLALALCIASGASWAASDPVPLAPGTEPVALDGHVAVLADEAGQWTLADVTAPELAARFAAGDGDSFSYGYTRFAYWYRAVLRNPPEATDSDWVIEVKRPVLDHVDVHVTRPGGQAQTFLTGDKRQAPPEQMAHRTFAIPLRIAPGEEVTIHVRARTAGAHWFQMRAWSQQGFQANAARENFIYGAVLGGILLIALYNAVVFAWLGDRAYLYYVLWLVANVCLWLSFFGYARQYGNSLSAGAPAWINASAVCLQLLGSLFNVIFVREFLELRQRAPRLYAVATAAAAASAVALVLYPVLGFTLSDQISDIVSVLCIPFVLATAAYLALKGFRPALFYLLAWSVGFLAVLVGILELAGLLPFRATLEIWIPGVLIGVLVLSLALADRVATERREREKLSRLKRFFSPQVASAIVEEGEAALLAPRRREVTVLFTDLRGFTAFSAESEPEEVIRVLREYREVIVALAAKHHGTLEHFSGDGVMVYFNAPVEIPEPEAGAVRMAFELQQQLGALCQAWRQRTHELGVGIGMASGFATVGAVGFKDRLDYSVIGSVTNLAARLCAQAQHGQILVSRKLLLKIEKLVAADHLGEQELKGLPKPVTVYNLTGLAAA